MSLHGRAPAIVTATALALPPPLSPCLCSRCDATVRERLLHALRKVMKNKTTATWQTLSDERSPFPRKCTVRAIPSGLAQPACVSFVRRLFTSCSLSVRYYNPRCAIAASVLTHPSLSGEIPPLRAPRRPPGNCTAACRDQVSLCSSAHVASPRAMRSNNLH